MWFKQVQLFEFAEPVAQLAKELETKLAELTFTPCLPSLPSSTGWVPPIDEGYDSLVRTINDYSIFCLQLEEKILPATVIRQELDAKIKEIETAHDRKVYRKEKLLLKDELTLTLLPRAFTKITKIHAYIDSKNNWLIINTNNQKKIEQFMAVFAKCVLVEIRPVEMKKISYILTHWLKNKDYPQAFAIEKNGVLQDPNQQNRIIRCQQQDLFAVSIQTLLKDGCEVAQLEFSWQDQLSFVLTADFTVRSIKYQDELVGQVKDMEAETKQQQFDAEFFIMTQTLSGLLNDLMAEFAKDKA